MTEDKLLARLTELRQRDSGSAAEPQPFPHPEGLTFARAWQLAQDPSDLTESERGHLETCRRCANLLATARQELPNETALPR